MCIRDRLNHFQEGDLLLLQNEINELPYIIERAKARKMVIVLNPSPYNEALSACDLSKVSIFMINEIEGEQMTGEQNAEDILCCLQRLYPESDVVLTLGDKGVMYQSHGETVRIEAKKVQAVDTTAAGDTFTGYFIAGLLEGLDSTENLSRCVRASAITVVRPGAAESIPTKEEVDHM